MRRALLMALLAVVTTAGLHAQWLKVPTPGVPRLPNGRVDVVYTITEGVHVLVITYGCRERSTRDAVVSAEHTRLRWVPLAEVSALAMPEGYKSSIRRWVEHS